MDENRRMLINMGAGLLAFPSLALAQEAASAYPSRPVRLVAPYPAGSVFDAVGRRLADALSASLAGSFVVENKTGAGGAVGAMEVIRSAPNGYNLLLTVADPIVTTPATMKVNYDPRRDFTPITKLVRSYPVLMIHSSYKSTTLTEFIDEAKAAPNPLSFAHTDVKTDPLTFSQGTTKSNTKNTLFAASYDFSAVKLFAHLGQIKTDGSNTGVRPDDNVSHKIWEVSALVPVGPGRIMLGYGERKGNETLSPHTYRKLGALGYTYSLSKRTDLYTLLRADRTRTQNPPTLATTSSASGTSYAVGMRHFF